MTVHSYEFLEYVSNNAMPDDFLEYESNNTLYGYLSTPLGELY